MKLLWVGPSRGKLHREISPPLQQTVSIKKINPWPGSDEPQYASTAKEHRCSVFVERWSKAGTLFMAKGAWVRVTQLNSDVIFPGFLDFYCLHLTEDPWRCIDYLLMTGKKSAEG